MIILIMRFDENGMLRPARFAEDWQRAGRSRVEFGRPGARQMVWGRDSFALRAAWEHRSQMREDKYMDRASLVVMAAGMASRYGGNKQIEGMGPHGEILMEYSIHDAIRAGFTKVVFVIRPEMEARMREICAARLEGKIEIRYAFQDFSSIPEFYAVPPERVKPFGTVHAVLCARPQVEEPFAVINADDYYGVESFAQMYGFLTGLSGPRGAAMLGYRLKNTVSRHGTVTRGICRVADGKLAGVREVKKIRLLGDGHIVNETDPAMPEFLDPEAPVSMNFWGFSDEIFEPMDAAFRRFLEGVAPGDLTAEYLLPVFVDGMIRAGKLDVSVLRTDAIWFGVTYKEDRPAVVEALRKLHAEGVY